MAIRVESNTHPRSPKRNSSLQIILNHVLPDLKAFKDALTAEEPYDIVRRLLGSLVASPEEPAAVIVKHGITPRTMSELAINYPAAARELAKINFERIDTERIANILSNSEELGEVLSSSPLYSSADKKNIARLACERDLMLLLKPFYSKATTEFLLELQQRALQSCSNRVLVDVMNRTTHRDGYDLVTAIDADNPGAIDILLWHGTPRRSDRYYQNGRTEKYPDISRDECLRRAAEKDYDYILQRPELSPLSTATLRNALLAMGKQDIRETMLRDKKLGSVHRILDRCNKE